MNTVHSPADTRDTRRTATLIQLGYEQGLAEAAFRGRLHAQLPTALRAALADEADLASTR